MPPINQRHYVSLITLVVAAVIALAFTSYAALQHSKLKQGIATDQFAMTNLKSRALDSVEKRSKLKHYEKTLDDLTNIGLLGDANRLNWVETLVESVHKNEIPNVKFTLFPTVNEADLEENSSPYNYTPSDLSLTRMSLEMELMHARDFYDLLTDYREKSQGVFTVEFCEIRRIEQSGVTKPHLLTGVCNLQWYNYRDLRSDWDTIL